MSSQPDLSRLTTETTLRHCDYFEELGSTNDLALEWIANQQLPELPCLIWARTQTQGRGRGANSWWAATGALTFSIILDLSELGLPVERRPQISLATGLAVRHALQEFLPGIDVRVKWPNDVYAAERKICGILVEVPPGRSGLCVIGIGINVGNSFATAPLELRVKAGALCDLTAETPELEMVLLRVIQELEIQLRLLCEGVESLTSVWGQHCLLTGRRIEHTAGERLTAGLCRGIADDGALLLQTDHGLERLLGGVITRWN